MRPCSALCSFPSFWFLLLFRGGKKKTRPLTIIALWLFAKLCFWKLGFVLSFAKISSFSSLLMYVTSLVCLMGQAGFALA